MVLAVAALDSDALVRDSAFGGTAHTAAAIALLGAIDALRQHPAAQPAQREVPLGDSHGTSFQESH